MSLTSDRNLGRHIHEGDVHIESKDFNNTHSDIKKEARQSRYANEVEPSELTPSITKSVEPRKQRSKSKRIPDLSFGVNSSNSLKKNKKRN